MTDRPRLDAVDCETMVFSSSEAMDACAAILDQPSAAAPALGRQLLDGSSLRGLSDTAKLALVRNFKTRSFLPGDYLLRQGELGEGLFILEEGLVEVRVSQQNTHASIDFSGAGHIVGEMSLLTAVPCTADVLCVEPTRGLFLRRDDFQSLRQSYPELEIALSQLVSDRLGARETDALSGKLIGGYRLRRCISRGGMGVVYEAHCPDEKPVALKMLRHRFVHEAAAIERFIQEGKLLSELKHPNLVAVQDCFVAFNTQFLTMDYWDGKDLARILHAKGCLDDETCRGILGQVAQGLKYAHAAGVLHLDIKPANILVSHDGRVALTDFGLSRLVGSSEGVQVVVGTPPYMPPEQFQGRGVSEASDWYALACTCAELLTGKRLFPQPTFRKCWDAKASQIPDEKWLNLPSRGEFGSILMDALQPDPQQRALDLDAMAAWAKLVPGLCPDA